ncbi:MAG: WD40/YVTN/BNR-like repeat-containing protein [Planctomycetota bacterium]|jgi:photosystem II stability/assembly factor-like uncharacterized protein
MNRLILLFSAMLLFLCFSLPDEEMKFSPKWLPQESNTKASLRGVCAVNHQLAWASGSDGVCLRTMNGGKIWKKIRVPDSSNSDFRDVHAFDEHTALLLVAGQPAKIWKTMDGGLHWTEQFESSDPDIFLDAFAFRDENQGIAFSDPVKGGFFLLITEDGGDTWERIPPEKIPSPVDGEAGYAASGTCIAVAGDGLAWFATGGAAARVFRSEDHGRSWSAARTPMICGSPSAGIFSIAFRDKTHGVIVGGDYKNPEEGKQNAARTEDGGKTWTLAKEPFAGYRSCVACLPVSGGQAFIAVGPTGSDYSLDDGETWKPFDSAGYNSISFAGRYGWAVGPDGSIARFALEK